VAVAVLLLALVGLVARDVFDTVTAQPASTAAAPSSTPTPQDQPKGLLPSPPVWLAIPKLGVHSSLVPLGLNPDGSVQVPSLDDPMQAGWYSYGPTPGEVGPAVLLGHVDGYQRAGVFYRLRQLAPGDEVLVTRKDGARVAFRVRRVDVVPKPSFPTQAVYGNTTVPELRLVTCGGPFDRAAASYQDNVIVYAAME
jgi:sortase (surface protein transpeptidase)